MRTWLHRQLAGRCQREIKEQHHLLKAANTNSSCLSNSNTHRRREGGCSGKPQDKTGPSDAKGVRLACRQQVIRTHFMLIDVQDPPNLGIAYTQVLCLRCFAAEVLRLYPQS